ncbi:colicin immunity domain-containing protein [Klebsiella michiganensis]|uniref:Colicin immunity protein n=1 Tax=Klebsiella michiganensis TaxID=1134687 RepID=A0A6P1UWI5_9ENTR|nr:colicin immunity domain-containing protein [Klebsiella michiganensis]MEB8292135.1 colicin immunity domain-containing protein [Klebsiella michiganensis]MXJ83425.1 colicin immunity protein [Klebsiella michiganensis]QHS47281.1 colicin immunity protein [Klebsiella michiganensis]
MSYLLIEFARSFGSGRLSAVAFADAYMELWRIERDSKNILNYDENVSECLSSIFCVADMYNPDDDRDQYEFDEEELRKEINKLIDTYINK